MLNPDLSKLILEIRFSCIKKVSMYFIFTLLILCGINFNFNFDITMSCFLSPHINFMCDKDSVIISKVHDESIFLYNSLFNMVFVKVYYNMDNLKIDNVNVEYDHLNPTKSFGVDIVMLMPPSIKKPPPHYALQPH